MAHSYIQAFHTEEEAFRTFADDVPFASTFLVDTYDTLGGVAKAISVIKDLGIESSSAIRLDSGDLVTLARESRPTCSIEPACTDVRIFVSGGLNERDIEQMLAAGAPIDAVGVGTRLGVSADAPYLDSVYKLVDYEGRPIVKLSEGKQTLPGAKQVFRSPGLDDVLGLRQEDPGAGTAALARDGGDVRMVGDSHRRPPGEIATRFDRGPRCASRASQGPGRFGQRAVRS